MLFRTVRAPWSNQFWHRHCSTVSGCGLRTLVVLARLQREKAGAAEKQEGWKKEGMGGPGTNPLQHDDTTKQALVPNSPGRCHQPYYPRAPVYCPGDSSSQETYDGHSLLASRFVRGPPAMAKPRNFQNISAEYCNWRDSVDECPEGEHGAFEGASARHQLPSHAVNAAATHRGGAKGRPPCGPPSLAESPTQARQANLLSCPLLHSILS